MSFGTRGVQLWLQASFIIILMYQYFKTATSTISGTFLLPAARVLLAEGFRETVFKQQFVLWCLICWGRAFAVLKYSWAWSAAITPLCIILFCRNGIKSRSLRISSIRNVQEQNFLYRMFPGITIFLSSSFVVNLRAGWPVASIVSVWKKMVVNIHCTNTVLCCMFHFSELWSINRPSLPNWILQLRRVKDAVLFLCLFI